MKIFFVRAQDPTCVRKLNVELAAERCRRHPLEFSMHASFSIYSNNISRMINFVSVDLHTTRPIVAFSKEKEGMLSIWS